MSVLPINSRNGLDDQATRLRAMLAAESDSPPRQQQPPPQSPEMQPLTLDDEQTYNEIDSRYERDLSPHENGPPDGTTRCADGTPRSVARQVREPRSHAAAFRSCYSEDQDVECMGSGDEAGV